MFSHSVFGRVSARAFHMKFLIWGGWFDFQIQFIEGFGIFGIMFPLFAVLTEKIPPDGGSQMIVFADECYLI